jgi:DNA helicase IV
VTRDPELQAEQAYVDAAFERLDAMRAAARQVREAYADVQRGGTHQARLERDIAYEVTARRLASLEIGDNPLAFGRLDLDDESTIYVGRLGVDDEHHEPLVVDWRAPIAEPFYRATGVLPMGVVRRRHFLTRHGRELVGLDDEVFDHAASERRGLRVTGEGALLAALEAERTGRMGDIVATIQAEQDQAIRSELPGVLVVGGGPGTGKTAVALHRAAYLLYTYRDRLSVNGVLLVGPGPVFLRYIEQVLPSLGESEVQLATIQGLKPRLRTGPERPEVARVKGDIRMAEVIARALDDRRRPLRGDVHIVVDGFRVTLRRHDSARIVEGARRRRGSHNEQRPYVVRRVLDLLVGRWKTAAVDSYRARRLDRATTGTASVTDLADPTVVGALARGEQPPDGWERDLRDRLRARPEVVAAIEWMWPVLSGEDLLHDLFSFPALVRSAADGLLDESEQALLHRERAASVAEAMFSDADVALVDEADALLGPPEAARPRRRRRRGPADEEIEQAARVIAELGLAGTTDARTLAGRYAGDGAPDDEPHALRVFGHVLVDEAQDLTAMEWRMIARRCPSGSMTIVGDPGQASRPGALASWQEVLRLLPARRPPRLATLSVNYRTPAEIMDVASRLLAAVAPASEPSQSVRTTGEPPTFVTATPETLEIEVGDAVGAAVERGGKIAVVAPSDRHDSLLAALAGLDVAAGSAEALDAQIGILDADDVKGLEFDHVVVVEPAKLVTPDRSGLRLLYTAITRATKTLTIVHAEPLPEALGPAGPPG